MFVSVRCILIDLSGYHVIAPCYLLPEDDQRMIELNDAVPYVVIRVRSPRGRDQQTSIVIWHSWVDSDDNMMVSSSPLPHSVILDFIHLLTASFSTLRSRYRQSRGRTSTRCRYPHSPRTQHRPPRITRTSLGRTSRRRRHNQEAVQVIFCPSLC